MRIWHQSVTELAPDGAYARSLAGLARKVLGGRATVEVFGLPAGAYAGRAASTALGNAFLYHRILDRIIDQAIRAEREGYDAFVIGSFSEPFLDEIRSVLAIPVVSVFEASLLVGCSLGTKLGFVATSPNVAAMVEKALAHHHMEGRVGAVLALDPPLIGEVLLEGFADPAPQIAAFEAAAGRALAQGADVLIPAEGIIAAVVTEQGVTRFREAPVIDVFGVTWSYACMLAELRRSSGLGVTRRGRFSPPDAELFRRMTGQPGGTP